MKQLLSDAETSRNNSSFFIHLPTSMRKKSPQNETKFIFLGKSLRNESMNRIVQATQSDCYYLSLSYLWTAFTNNTTYLT
jgi:hypothetical protein